MITSDGYFDGGSTSPLASLTGFSVTGPQLPIDRTRLVIKDGYELLGDDGAFTADPRYLTANLHQVAVWFSSAHGVEQRYADCNTATGVCAASRNEQSSDLNAGEITGMSVSNPSRPLGP